MINYKMPFANECLRTSLHSIPNGLLCILANNCVFFFVCCFLVLIWLWDNTISTSIIMSSTINKINLNVEADRRVIHFQFSMFYINVPLKRKRLNNAIFRFRLSRQLNYGDLLPYFTSDI